MFSSRLSPPPPSLPRLFLVRYFSANVDTSGKYPVYNDRGTFYTALMEFTEDGDNARFLSDISFNDDGEIEVRAPPPLPFWAKIFAPSCAVEWINTTTGPPSVYVKPMSQWTLIMSWGLDFCGKSQ